ISAPRILRAASIRAAARVLHFGFLVSLPCSNFSAGVESPGCGWAEPGDPAAGVAGCGCAGPRWARASNPVVLPPVATKTMTKAFKFERNIPFNPFLVRAATDAGTSPAVVLVAVTRADRTVVSTSAAGTAATVASGPGPRAAASIPAEGA